MTPTLVEARKNWCTNSIIGAYIRNNRISDILNSVEVEDTDGSFTQIGLKSIIKNAWFYEDNYMPSFGDLGLSVTVGEERYLVNYLLKNCEDKTENITKLSASTLHSKLYGLGTPEDLVIITSISTKFDFLLRDRRFGVKYISQKPYLDVGVPIPILTINETKLDGKIIILDKNALVLKYKVTQNTFVNRKMKLSVLFEQMGQGIAIEVKSIIKIELVDANKIKILKFDPSTEGKS